MYFWTGLIAQVYILKPSFNVNHPNTILNEVGLTLKFLWSLAKLIQELISIDKTCQMQIALLKDGFFVIPKSEE
jgi:hypothetical protein